MFEAVDSPYLVPFDGTFRIDQAPTAPPEDAPGKRQAKKLLREQVGALRDLQRVLFADGRYAVLLVFQAMDGGGKDSTIRAVMTGVNPAGCRVVSFKQPSDEELRHHFLWRTTRRLPARGEIGIFNRSHYEEVLVVRVHPELLEAQRLPPVADLEALWQERYAMIRHQEHGLARNGTVVIKFWLHLSNGEQRRRFLRRIDRPEKNWKFSESDVRERERWDDYMEAYASAVSATSRAWAPWYAIPADSKPFMRLAVAEIIVRSLERLDLRFPELDREEHERLLAARQLLLEEQL
ncbi:MAG: polyphosphate kinase 2 family protein [Candidatus Eiseniibacteriota bacterium]|jgi:PPK2 family polyphosphate:nucleotide phosphotransferase